jgi:hypothetical protein
MLILDTKYQQQGEQQIADIPKNERCFVIWDRLQFWDYHSWKHLVLGHEFRENIFSISNTTTSGKLLNVNVLFQILIHYILFSIISHYFQFFQNKVCMQHNMLLQFYISV